MTTNKNYYDSLDDAYKDLLTPLSRYAAQHLYRKDEAIDAAHDAFQKALEYLAKHNTRKISKYVLFRETIRACRRRNKKSVEVPHDFSESASQKDSEGPTKY